MFSLPSSPSTSALKSVDAVAVYRTSTLQLPCTPAAFIASSPSGVNETVSVVVPSLSVCGVMVVLSVISVHVSVSSRKKTAMLPVYCNPLDSLSVMANSEKYVAILVVRGIAEVIAKSRTSPADAVVVVTNIPSASVKYPLLP